MIEFTFYVKRFSNVQSETLEEIAQKGTSYKECLQLRAHLFYFLHHLILYIDKEESKRIEKIYKDQQAKFME